MSIERPPPSKTMTKRLSDAGRKGLKIAVRLTAQVAEHVATKALSSFPKMLKSQKAPRNEDVSSVKANHVSDETSQLSDAFHEKGEGEISHNTLAKIARLAYMPDEDIAIVQQNPQALKKKYKDIIRKKRFAGTEDQRKEKREKYEEKVKYQLERRLDNLEDMKSEGIQFLKDADMSHHSENFQKKAKALQKVIDRAPNGLHMRVMEKDNSLVFAFRGTKSAQDVMTDATLGKRQYEPVQQALKEFIDAAVEEDPTKSMMFTGHSLGGGLSEIAGYFAKQDYPQANVSVVSFNGFGAAQPIAKLNEGKFDPDVAKSINGTQYSTHADIVSRVGVSITRNKRRVKSSYNLRAAHSMKAFEALKKK